MLFGLSEYNQSENAMTVHYWPILLKKSPWFPQQKSKRLRLKSLLCAEDSGLRFRVAARKKGIFISQYAGSLEVPTFSTQSADLCLSRKVAIDPQLKVTTDRNRLKEVAANERIALASFQDCLMQPIQSGIGKAETGSKTRWTACIFKQTDL
jgi:hypothetical protein